MKTGAVYRRMHARTREKTEVVWGVLVPVERDSALYARWAQNGVGEKRRGLYRFFGRGKELEDGVSCLLCRGKPYLVLESRTMVISGRAVMTDALVQEM